MLDPASVLHSDNMGPLAINGCALATWLRIDVLRASFSHVRKVTSAFPPKPVSTFLHSMAPRKKSLSDSKVKHEPTS